MFKKASRQKHQNDAEKHSSTGSSSAVKEAAHAATSHQHDETGSKDLLVDPQKPKSRSNGLAGKRSRRKRVSSTSTRDSSPKARVAPEQAAAGVSAMEAPPADASRSSASAPSRRLSDAPDHQQKPVSSTCAAASTADSSCVAATPVKSTMCPTSSTTSGVHASQVREDQDLLLPERSLGEHPQPISTKPAVALEEPPTNSLPQLQPSSGAVVSMARPPRRGARSAQPPPSLLQPLLIQLRREDCHAPHLKQIWSLVPHMDAIAAPLAVLISVTILLLVLLLLPGIRRNGGGLKVCDTRGCVEHALALGIDDSRIPSACDDFAAFVCPSWKAADLDVTRTVYSQAVLRSIVSLEKMSIDKYEAEAVVNRPLRMMRECMHRSADDPDGVMSLIELVDGSNFAWPTVDDDWPPITDYSRPLQLILELSVTWALPLWFRVQVLPARSPLQKERAVVLSGSALAVIWHGLHNTLLQYEDAYSVYVSYFNDSIFKYRPPSEPFISFVRTKVSVQTEVLGNLNSAFHDRYKQPRLVEIRSLPTWIRKVGADEWVKALNSVYGTQQNITESDLLLATNEKLLSVADSIFNATTAQDVFFHTIWWFLQSVGSATSNTMFLTLSEHSSGKYIQRIMCFDNVNTAYNALLASIDKAMRPAREQLSITTLLENVHAVALEKVRSYSKLNSTTRKVLVALLEDMSTVIWPEYDFGTPGGFLQFYGEPYRGTDGFFGEWKWSRLQMQNRSVALFTSKEYVGAAEVYSVANNRLVNYIPVLNTMSISTAALEPPFYYKDGTSAMTYAGLGYMYAQGLFEALDMMTHLFNGGIVMEPSDLPETSAFWNASWCPDAEINRYTFPELPALDVTYAAYVRAKDGASDWPLKGLEDLSPEKIFFATFCYCNCYFDASKRKKLSEVCIAAAQQFDPFARVFSCPDGSEMNKSPKCDYS